MVNRPTAPAEPPAVDLVEPGPPPRWWEETPAEAARADDRYWDSRFDRDED